MATALILVGGLSVLHEITLGFRAFTAETARRIQVRESPRPVPAFRMQRQDGSDVTLAELRGRYTVATFMYGNCQSICPMVAARMSQFPPRLLEAFRNDRVHLLSISFDPERDTPQVLSQHAGTYDASLDNWWVVRPREPLSPLLDFFRVTVIPAGNGMFIHNAAFYLIGPDLRLIDIIDEDEPQRVLEVLEARL